MLCVNPVFISSKEWVRGSIFSNCVRVCVAQLCYLHRNGMYPFCGPSCSSTKHSTLVACTSTNEMTAQQHQQRRNTKYWFCAARTIREWNMLGCWILFLVGVCTVHDRRYYLDAILCYRYVTRSHRLQHDNICFSLFFSRFGFLWLAGWLMPFVFGACDIRIFRRCFLVDSFVSMWVLIASIEICSWLWWMDSACYWTVVRIFSDFLLFDFSYFCSSRARVDFFVLRWLATAGQWKFHDIVVF